MVGDKLHACSEGGVRRYVQVRVDVVGILRKSLIEKPAYDILYICNI